MDIEQIYTIKDQFVIHSDWWIDLIDLKLIGWLIELLFRKSTWCNRTKNMGTTFSTTEWKEKKRKLTLVKFKKTTLDTGSKT